MRGRQFGWRRGKNTRPVVPVEPALNLPGPRGALGGRLVERWCEASLEAGWSAPGHWWNPAVDAVAEALLDDEDPTGPCAQLARHRAVDGVSLEETIGDLAALWSVARLGSPTFAATRAASLAWVEAAQHRIEAVGCIDSRTGLGTTSHVEARLSELYAEGRRHGYSPAETHALVVVELDAVAETGNPWDLALRLSHVAECLRTVFDAGQVIGMAGPGRAVAVVPRATDLPRTAEALRRMLNEWRRTGTGAGPMVWVESLPVERPAAQRLLHSLCV
jgi:GGDEF domain-containing protein